MKKRTILFLITACLTALFMTVSASAAGVASGKCGENLTWVLDDEGTLTISGSGAMYDWVSSPPLGFLLCRHPHHLPARRADFYWQQRILLF